MFRDSSAPETADHRLARVYQSVERIIIRWPWPIFGVTATN